MQTLKVIKYQLRDAFRSRWVIFYGLLFLLITDVLFRFGGDGSRVLVSLINVVLLFIPLISTLMGTMYIYNSRSYMELLLCQPIKRSSLYWAFYLGLTLPMIVAFLVGTLIPFFYHGGFGEGVLMPLMLLLASGVALNVIFIALAFFLGLSFADRVKGLGLALFIWFFFSVIYDGIILFIIYGYAQYPLEKPVIILTMLNPVDLGRVLLLLNFDISALMGFTGAVFKDFFGSLQGMLVTIGGLLAWITVPFILGFRTFLKKDF